MYLGLGAKKKVYMDDVFSTYLFEGNATARSINNGINLSGEGGMMWLKSRESGNNHRLFDTARGIYKSLKSNSNGAEYNSGAGLTLESFNTNGFNLGTSNDVNQDNDDTSTWTFRRAKGFFDVVTYTGNGSNRTIAHSLGSVPGCIMVKSTSVSGNWIVWHKSVSTGAQYLVMNQNSALNNGSGGSMWNSTAPTSSVFSIGTDSDVNANGQTYVAYVFAGGESGAATARSIELDGSDDYFQTTVSTDFEFSGDFTFECWFYPHSVSGSRAIFTIGQSNLEGGLELYMSNKTFKIDDAGLTKIQTKSVINMDQWHHVALVRSGTSNRLYFNGTDVGGYTTSNDYGINSGSNRSSFYMGNGYNGATEHFFDGHISNVRVLNGTALYTSSFRPPTEPLTNITNTKLLCCNNSSVTGSTVAPTTLYTNGAVASAKHPFDDPAAFTFGDEGDQNVIKCGSYTGNGSATGPEINLGFEPQWLMIKNTGAAEHWSIFDSMRGIVTGGNDEHIKASSTDGESGNTDWMALTPTGFKINTTGGEVNQNGMTHIFIAIRRNDGYVGKPVEVGTDAFSISAGGSSTYSSGFPVDFAWYKNITSSGNQHWYSTARLLQGKEFKFNATDALSSWSGATFDSNNSWGTSVQDANHRSWMFKRHKGFDAVTYKGEGGNNTKFCVPHSLNAVPEMMWVKRTNDTENWTVYHKGLNGGTNPEQYYIPLNSTDAEADSDTRWNDIAPTSTHFSIGYSNATGKDGDSYLALLFSSVNGISKVGYYNGTGSTGLQITTGFAPKFVLVRRINTTQYWANLDTNRGWDGTNDQELYLNESSAGNTASTATPTSTGFTITSTSATWNASGDKYIYYAHA